MLTTTPILKVVYLVTMLCSGDPRDQNCGDEYAPKSWEAPTQVAAKKECETYLRDDFDPNDFFTMTEDSYVAVRCE